MLKVAPIVVALMAINASISPYVRGQRTTVEPGRLAAALTFPVVFFSLAAFFWFVRRRSLRAKD